MSSVSRLCNGRYCVIITHYIIILHYTLLYKEYQGNIFTITGKRNVKYQLTNKYKLDWQGYLLERRAQKYDPFVFTPY